VRLLKNEDQETGIFAAPAMCEYDFNEDECKTARGESEITHVKNVYVRGFSVEGYPKNGIQTRWVDGFQLVSNHSINNLNNGIYPTLSANGLVRENVSYGSLDTAMWVAGSENVRVVGNELFGSVIGFEITVSNNVLVRSNNIYDNSVGIGLFHPDGAGNPPLPEMKNWVVKNNNIYDNNRLNDAPEGSFQKDLPSGGGVLLLGVSDHRVMNNTVKDNGYVGIAVFGWCTSLLGTGRDCTGPEADPLRARDASNNLIKSNLLLNNGRAAEIPESVSPVDFTQDLAYFHYADIDPSFSFFEAPGVGNCFKGNLGKSKGPNKKNGTVVTIFSSYKLLEGKNELPTDGC
jgi:parallel beta-helix repeat protein